MALGPQNPRETSLTAAGGIDAAAALPVQQATRPALVDELPESLNYVAGFTSIWIPNPPVDFAGNESLAAVYIMDVLSPAAGIPGAFNGPANIAQEFALTSVRFKLMSTNPTAVNIWGLDTTNPQAGYNNPTIIIPFGVHLDPGNVPPVPLRPASGKTSAVLLLKNDNQQVGTWARRRMTFAQPNNPAFSNVGVVERPTTGIGQAICRCEFPPGNWSNDANIREISEVYSMEADPVRFRFGETLSIAFALSIGEAERIRTEQYGPSGPSEGPYVLSGFAQVSLKLRLTHSPTSFSRIN